MPRVNTQTARKSKKERRCARRGGCLLDGTIEPGQEYQSWSFRFGGTYYQHVACGRPARSQLTQSAMGEVYDAIETAEATIGEWDGDGTMDLASAIEEVAGAAESVMEQYREADEAFGGHGATEAAQRADDLEGWKDELDQFFAEDFQGDEPEEGEARTEEQQEEFDNWVEEQRQEAQSVLDNCPL